MGDKEVVSNQLFIDRWFFPEPKLIPDSDGNIVIVSKVSVGPCEYFEWGITADMTCFEKYEWCENDFEKNWYQLREKTGSDEQIIRIYRNCRFTSFDAERQYFLFYTGSAKRIKAFHRYKEP